MAEQPQTWRAWTVPLVLLGGVALAWSAVLLGLDFWLTGEGSWQEFWVGLTGYGAADMQQVLGNLPEVVVAILGIAVTVVSIILQLSATRYTPQVTELFFRDRTNLLVIGFFVVASVHCIWAAAMVHDTFIPHLTVIATLVMMSAAILILIPYFSYIFAFLDPEHIVSRIQQNALDQALSRRTSSGIEQRQRRVIRGAEQLADIVVNAISQKDRVIASRGVHALRDLLLEYAARKEQLADSWFELGPTVHRNPDFVAMAPGSVAELEESRVWLEWKVLRQYEAISAESLVRLRSINQLVAIDTRYLGEKAVEIGDPPLLHLVFKFFNTYLRAAINGRDVRSAYNILHQYRLLGEVLLATRWDDAVVELARYFKYYGLTANAAGLPFVNETAAYDLCALCEKAHQQQFPRERDLLGILLEVDKQPENEAQEQSLRGVRKAQIKLAVFYLVHGSVKLARQIWRDMEHERPERLLSIREEMEQVEDEDFWEVIDRGYNFDYLDPARRQQLGRFYQWFSGLERSGVRADRQRLTQTLYGPGAMTMRVPGEKTK